ncbi:MAG: tetratricopeptide repeat protein [Ardenticatenales bacterium]|nr:tetratricopeptide repeat protein [Ardenticatenales bacterium]
MTQAKSPNRTSARPRNVAAPPSPETTIEIGGWKLAVFGALIALALVVGLAIRFARSSAGARMQAQLMLVSVPVPEPAALLEMEPDVQHAIAAARAAVEADRGSAVAWRHLGMIYDAHSIWPLAVTAYQRALSMAPTDGQTAYYLAVATEMSDAPIDDILAAYKHAIALAPTYGPARLRLGDALMRVGRHVEARDVLMQAVNVYPPAESARARRSLGLALIALGDADGAVVSLEAATRIRDDDANTFTALAQAYNQLNRGQDARRATDRAAQLRESLGYFDNWRKAVLEEAVSRSLVETRIMQKMEVGVPDQALADALRWEAKHPDWQSIKVLIGNLHRTAGREDLAKPYFEAATALIKQGGKTK